ncbi:hypothetical protein MBM_06060 [Drepanopeziza brunnea f. sp. 'multigermtubi' MB_m1]|uniref:DUF6590 domain-containing protein n=1 Tax=Marssonina brunnea f. sp. multigermtubi (strain MB_m1) TaxID=1072389 RepID=K1XTW9_MARBU|nr:uncharacterized protein MBM_06060 [Drepanopeziza brunnea f. sp. 'multigermtubi' MB_m1]EKD16049.1 hypothetical protein MBM_06060 [Drepanopeziza brunnea f. sp. 'multigermtubi' MB_m1]
MAAAVLDLPDAKFPQLGKTAIPAQNGSNRPKRSQTVTGRGGRGRPLSNPQQASVITFRKYGDKFKPETYSPGDVISVPFHIADYEQPPVNPGIHSSLCKLGPYVYSKFRRLIILDCYVDHCVAIPLFTNNGAGLKKKVAKGEWVGVRDAADPVREAALPRRQQQPELDEEHHPRALRAPGLVPLRQVLHQDRGALRPGGRGPATGPAA